MLHTGSFVVTSRPLKKLSIHRKLATQVRNVNFTVQIKVKSLMYREVWFGGEISWTLRCINLFRISSIWRQKWSFSKQVDAIHGVVFIDLINIKKPIHRLEDCYKKNHILVWLVTEVQGLNGLKHRDKYLIPMVWKYWYFIWTIYFCFIF